MSSEVRTHTPPPPPFPHPHTQSQVSGADRQQLTDLESLLLATLQSLLRKVSSTDALSIADTVMTALLMMFQSSLGHSGGVQEDVVLTVGVLVEGELLRRGGRGGEGRGERRGEGRERERGWEGGDKRGEERGGEREGEREGGEGEEGGEGGGRSKKN